MAKRRIPRYQQEEQAIAHEKLTHAKGVGRIRADLTKQAPNNSYGPAKLYYEDLEFTCRDCQKKEIWTAEQQQWWYEVARGSIHTTAIRCRTCRQARRGQKNDSQPAVPPAETDPPPETKK